MMKNWVDTTCDESKPDGSPCRRKLHVPANMWNEPSSRDCGEHDHGTYTKEEKEKSE